MKTYPAKKEMKIMKTYPAKKEIKIMGISMLIMGVLLLFDDILFNKFLFRISYLIAIVLIIYGMMHVSKLERFK